MAFQESPSVLIKRALNIFPWEEHLKKLTDPSDQVELLTRTILNIMSNFIPNEIKKFRPSEPAWFNNDIRYSDINLDQHVVKQLRCL